jgi:hypothetical protein
MSDIKLAEFRERAERGLGLPDLEDLERRGRSLRRRRAAAGAGGLALALAAIAGIAHVATGGPDTAPAPGPATQPPSPASGLSLVPGDPEDLLALGPAWVNLDADEAGAGESPVKVVFDVADAGWEWSTYGMGLRRSAEARDDYAASVFFLPHPTARLGSCGAERVEALGNDPGNLLANVAPLLDLARSSVLEQPQVVTAFGHTAVHLRLRTDSPCPGGGADLTDQLAGQSSGGTVKPGWEVPQTLDVWHIVLPGEASASILVASWEHVGATDAQLVDRQEMLDSVELESEGE